jgi:DNA-binding beta-propeller fold protein YncE
MFRPHSHVRIWHRRHLLFGAATAVALLAGAAPAQAAPFVYVANQFNGTVSQYDVMAGGLLASLSPPTVAARPEPRSVAVSPDGKSVYVSIIGFGFGSVLVRPGISQYDVGAGGTLSPKSPAAVSTGCEAVQVAVSPDGKNVYGSGGPDCSFLTQYDVGPGGALSPKSPAFVEDGEGLGVAVSPDSQSVYVANNGDSVSQFDVGPGGALSPKSPPTVPAGHGSFGVAVSPDGKSVYATSRDVNSISQYDVGPGGTLSPKSPATVAAGDAPVEVAVSPDGRSVYVTNSVNQPVKGTVSQYDVGPGGGLLPKNPATVDAGDTPEGIALSPDGQSVYVANWHGDLSQYDVGPGGALSPKSPATVATGDGPVAVAVSPVPTTKGQCKHGGWMQFGFKNQGRCIRFVKQGAKKSPPGRRIAPRPPHQRPLLTGHQRRSGAR